MAEARKVKRQLRQLLYGAKPHVYRVIFEVDQRRQCVWVLTDSAWRQKATEISGTGLISKLPHWLATQQQRRSQAQTLPTALSSNFPHRLVIQPPTALSSSLPPHCHPIPICIVSTPHRIVIQRSAATKDLQLLLTPKYAATIQNHHYFRIGANTVLSPRTHVFSVKFGKLKGNHMIAPCKTWLSVVLMLLVVSSCTNTCAQVTQATPNNDAVAISLRMKTEEIPVGQMPWAMLTMKNMSNRPVTVSSYRVHVEGKDGEPPTTLSQRQMTDTLRAGDAPMNVTLNVGPPVVQPDEPYVLKFELAYLYNLSAPGKYTVYAEVRDPSSNRWLSHRNSEIRDDRSITIAAANTEVFTHVASIERVPPIRKPPKTASCPICPAPAP